MESVFETVIWQLIGQQVAITIDDIIHTGTVFAADGRHVVIKDEYGMSLINVDWIKNLDWSPYIEIVQPSPQ